MAQKPKNFAVTVTTAGTRQRIVTDPASVYRYVRSAGFIAPSTNSGNIFVGDASVSSTLYSARITAGTRIDCEGDPIADKPGGELNQIDLYNTWVDSSVNGDVVNVAILERD